MGAGEGVRARYILYPRLCVIRFEKIWTISIDKSWGCKAIDLVFLFVSRINLFGCINQNSGKGKNRQRNGDKLSKI